MEKILANFFLVFTSLLGALAQTGLDGKVFVFTAPSTTNYVLLKPPLEAPLQHLTVCLSFFTDLERSFSLFSAASPQQDNEILFFFIFPGQYEVCVGGSCLTFHPPRSTEGSSSYWETACMAWESTTGIVQVWVNGQPLPRKGVAKGHLIPKDLVVMLGQEQDSYGGSLDASQSFVGEMVDVYMWDSVVPPEQLRRIRRDTMPKPLVDWMALKYEIKDLQKEVLVFPEASSSAGVTLKTSLQQPLTSFTVCLRHYTLLTRGCSLFSYASKRSDQEILIYKPKPNQYSLYLGLFKVVFTLPEKHESRPRWEHICVSWESSTGLVALWVNNYPMPRLGLRRGHTVNPDSSIVLGQDQEKGLWGFFDINESFVGEMTDVYMWKKPLSAEEVEDVFNDRIVSDSLIDWKSLNYQIRGNVVIKPSLYPDY